MNETKKCNYTKSYVLIMLYYIVYVYGSANSNLLIVVVYVPCISSSAGYAFPRPAP